MAKITAAKTQRAEEAALAAAAEAARLAMEEEAAARVSTGANRSRAPQ